MAFSPTNLQSMIALKMAYDGERQKVLAQNIASTDTPGYKAQDLAPINFKNALAMQNQQVTPSVTDEKHMTGMSPHTQKFRSMQQHNTFERTPVGNTVVVEEQMLKVAENATDYQMTTGLYKKIGNLMREAMGLQPAA